MTVKTTTAGSEHAAHQAATLSPQEQGVLWDIEEHFWTGWRSVVMAERRVTRYRDIAILTYRVSAEKPDVPIYKALCASTYLHDDDTWLRISHQQTAET